MVPWNVPLEAILHKIHKIDPNFFLKILKDILTVNVSATIQPYWTALTIWINTSNKQTILDLCSTVTFERIQQHRTNFVMAHLLPLTRDHSYKQCHVNFPNKLQVFLLTNLSFSHVFCESTCKVIYCSLFILPFYQVWTWSSYIKVEAPALFNWIREMLDCISISSLFSIFNKLFVLYWTWLIYVFQ